MSSTDRSLSGKLGNTTSHGPGRLRDQATTIGFLVLLVAFIGLVLVPGYRLANQLSADTAALRLASEHRSQPQAMAKSLAAIRDRLASGAYVGQALKDLNGAVQEFDLALAELQQSAAGDSRELHATEALWSGYRRIIAPVAGFEGLPYRDSDSGGAQLSPRGRQLLSETRQALKSSRTSTGRLSAAVSSIGSSLESRVATASATLRKLMIAGVVFACLLVAFLGYFQWLKARHERVAVEALEQTRDILSTVKDGLFLIDRDLRIGQAHSAALSALFRRERFDGITLQELLRDMVAEKTLATAAKYVKLLWGERANENLIRSINPLAEIEVHFDRPDGSRDLRYLEFDFHRVKGNQGVRHVLVSVNDVTSRVMLARELKASQANAQVQMDMLLGLLQLDPQQLVSFLDEANAALARVNDVLKAPARGDGDFRAKIDQLFREMHRIKGEAATLGLASIEDRAHAFEDMLNELRERQELSGSEFLPLVVRLDDLFGHLQSIRELMGRMDAMRAAALLTAAPQAQPASSPTAGNQDLTGPLAALAQRIAADHGKKIRLVSSGLEEVPGEYRRALHDIVVQLVRNAVVHGVEAPEVRRDADKDETGVLQVQFRPCDQGFELVFQDDGSGIIAERIRETAVRRGTITVDAAHKLDTRSTLALIFKPGFSTYEGADRDAGRGVGLDFVLKAVQSIGGKIGVATTPGRHTRFRIVLPAQTVHQGAVA